MFFPLRPPEGSDLNGADSGRLGMPLSTPSDPIDVAGAHAALERAWRELEARAVVDSTHEQAQRERLDAYVAGYVIMFDDEEELVRRRRYPVPQEVVSGLWLQSC